MGLALREALHLPAEVVHRGLERAAVVAGLGDIGIEPGVEPGFQPVDPPVDPIVSRAVV